MAHKEQQDFFLWVKNNHPNYFNNTNVIDVGCLDLNGNNRYLFSGGTYFGLDIIEGRNVDMVCPVHLYQTDKLYDVVINSEMLEHDKNYIASMKRMFELVRSGGILLITCAGLLRAEHGTSRTSPQDSPATNDYYRNLSMNDFYQAFPAEAFSEYYLKDNGLDMQFFGILK